jgi:hypothetical protein
MKASRVVLIACLTLASLVGCSADPSMPASATSTTYTCCEANDVDRAYHPGETLTIHWIVTSPTGAAAPSPGVELTARLTGPYQTVDKLKAATPDTRHVDGKATFTAPPVHPSGKPDEQPVSTIAIGADAEPGYYNLEFSVATSGGTSGGASIVQVVAKPEPA